VDGFVLILSEDQLELVWRNDFKLLVGAIARLFISTPTSELRRVPKTITLHVLVRHLYH
jgi:hypothetical protein